MDDTMNERDIIHKQWVDDPIPTPERHYYIEKANGTREEIIDPHTLAAAKWLFFLEERTS